MTSLDAQFLHMEDGVTHLHIAACAIFEGPTPAYADLARMLEAKLGLVPRYRQRVRFVPLGLGRPVWVDDPHFNIEYHVRHTALPPPGGDDDLRRLMGRLMSQPLDRKRPLWEMWMVEGLEDGRWAVISKIHHCMVDGVAGTELMTLLLDSERDAPILEPDPWVPEPEPDDRGLITDAVGGFLRDLGAQVASAAAATRNPTQVVRNVQDTAQGLATFGSGLAPVPTTSLDGPIGPHRRWDFAIASLDDIKQVKNALGGTVNDVVLAAITGGFRDLLQSRDEPLADRVLHTLVPVSVRSESAQGVLDNRVSAMIADLPVSIDDPVERLAAIHEQMVDLKASREAETGQALTSLIDLAFPGLLALGTRGAIRLLEAVDQHSVNTVTTNVPGPQFPLWCLGRELLEYHPFVPITPGVRIGVAILSYNGRVFFGITGDYEHAPDIGVLARGIDEAMAELAKAAAEKAGSPAG